MKKNKEIRLKRLRKFNTFIILGIALLSITTPTVYAATDPLSVINNLSNFIFDIVTAVGGIMVVFGIVQFGMALKSHDPSQKASSIFTIVGGLIIAFAKTILNIIMG